MTRHDWQFVVFVMGLALAVAVGIWPWGHGTTRIMPSTVIQAPPVPVQFEAVDRATLNAQAIGESLLLCRREAADRICNHDRRSKACIAATQAIEGDGVFERLKALNHDRQAQRRIALTELNECRGIGADSSLAMLLEQHVGDYK